MSEELERQWDNKHLEPPTKQWNRLSIDKKLQHCIPGEKMTQTTTAMSDGFL